MTPEIAEALYVALVTDTGRFMYENTSPPRTGMAAELIEAGVDVHDTYRRLYERVPIEKLQPGLAGHRAHRALRRMQAGGDLHLGRDYADTGATTRSPRGSSITCASLEGTEVAAMIRDKTDGGRAARKVSLRSTDGTVDVSAIARKHGGGGHVRAAGFSTDLSYTELVEFLCAEVKAQL